MYSKFERHSLEQSDSRFWRKRARLGSDTGDAERHTRPQVLDVQTTTLAPASPCLPTERRSVVLILVDSLGSGVTRALHYARSLRPAELRAVHLRVNARHAEDLRRAWEHSTVAAVPLDIIDVPDGRIRSAALELVARSAADGQTRVTVLLLLRRTYSLVDSWPLENHTTADLARSLNRLTHVTARTMSFEGTATPGPSALRRLLPSAIHATAPTPPATGSRSDIPTPIGKISWRQRITVEGQVRSLEVGQLSTSPVLKCELYDDTGGLTLVFYGRRQIPGIQPGTRMRATGMIGEMAGYLAMANPAYQLLPRDDEARD